MTKETQVRLDQFRCVALHALIRSDKYTHAGAGGELMTTIANDIAITMLRKSYETDDGIVAGPDYAHPVQ